MSENDDLLTAIDELKATLRELGKTLEELGRLQEGETEEIFDKVMNRDEADGRD